MSDEYGPRLAAVFGRVLRVAADSLDDGLRRGTLEEWDSLGHVGLVAELSKEFDVEIRPERALQMYTIGDIKRIIHELTRSDGDRP